MSKGLDALEIIKLRLSNNQTNKEMLNIIEKELKALEIITEKRVNVGDFVRCKSMRDYNDYCCYNEKEELTQEEFNFLRGILWNV